ncbi:hypothetical protein ACVFI8_10935 [Agarivorans sp. MS3-6]
MFKISFLVCLTLLSGCAVTPLTLEQAENRLFDGELADQGFKERTQYKVMSDPLVLYVKPTVAETSDVKNRSKVSETVSIAALLSGSLSAVGNVFTANLLLKELTKTEKNYFRIQYANMWHGAALLSSFNPNVLGDDVVQLEDDFAANLDAFKAIAKASDQLCSISGYNDKDQFARARGLYYKKGAIKQHMYICTDYTVIVSTVISTNEYVGSYNMIKFMSPTLDNPYLAEVYENFEPYIDRFTGAAYSCLRCGNIVFVNSKAGEKQYPLFKME